MKNSSVNRRYFIENRIGRSLYEAFIRNDIDREDLRSFTQKHNGTPASNNSSANAILSKCMDNGNLYHLTDDEIETIFDTIIMDWGYESGVEYVDKDETLFYIFKSLCAIWLKAIDCDFDSKGVELIIQSDITVEDYLKGLSQ